MAFLTDALATISRLNSAVEQRVFSLAEMDEWMDRQYYGLPTASGMYVTVDSALQLDAVWACVRKRAGSVASLPCILFRDLPDGGKAKNINHRLYDLLKNGPNPEMTAQSFWNLVVTHHDTWGNFYGQIVVDDYGAREIWPLDPSKCRWKRDPKDAGNRLWLEYRRTPSVTDRFEFEEIFHVANDTLDGITGLSPISMHRQKIGLGLAAQEYGARWFGNGGNPGGILQMKGKLSVEAAKRLKRDWEQAHSGTSNAHRVAVLEEDVTWIPTTIPPDDSQFLQTIKATKEDIAAIFNVPPHKVGLLEHTNRASIEEQNIEWVIDTIKPLCVRIEQSIQRDLINIGDGKRGVYARFQTASLLQGNAAAKAAVYAAGRQWGWYCADDIREMEDMNPLPDGQGKTFIVPLNMVPAGAELLDNYAPTPDSGPAIAPKGEDDPPDDVIGTKDSSSNGRSYFRELVPLLANGNGANGRH